MPSLLDEVAARAGFVPASRPDRDESRWRFSTDTHDVFVSARHELHRVQDDRAMARELEADLAMAREWVESVVSDMRILRVDRMELRPRVGFNPAAAPSGDEVVTLTRPEAQALHDPDSWPVLDEEPDV